MATQRPKIVIVTDASIDDDSGYEAKDMVFVKSGVGDVAKCQANIDRLNTELIRTKNVIRKRKITMELQRELGNLDMYLLLQTSVDGMVNRKRTIEVLVDEDDDEDEDLVFILKKKKKIGDN